ncbi:uncharacterized protein [Amphiura filiformis]|uniref:uncharacterized protein n=1 Tax=Amphiura filiformis TaxID=82378 RepID=UPI003B2174BA
MMSTDEHDIKVQVNGFHNEAFEGETQDDVKSAETFDDIDLAKDSPPPERRQNGGVAQTATKQNNGDISNNNLKAKQKSNGKLSSKKFGKTKKQKEAEIPVVFVGGRKIEVRHESQDYVRTQGLDNPAYEGDGGEMSYGGQRSPMAGPDGDEKEDGECCCRDCKCVLIILIVFVILALVAVAIVFLFLPKTHESEVEVVVVLDIPYIPQYDDLSSTEFKQLETDYTNDMNRAFLDSDQRDKYNGVEIVQLSPGSVRVVSIVRWLLEATLLESGKVNSQAQTEVGATILKTILRDMELGDIPVLNAWVVSDTPSEPLDLTCPADIEIEIDPGTNGAVVTWTAPDVIDDSGVISLVASQQSGSEFPIGMAVVTYTARNPSGDRVDCNFTINVIDTELPNITCPADIGPIGTDLGYPHREVTWDHPITSDNSGIVAIIRDDGSRINKHLAPIGETVITYNAADLSGNMVACSFMITIIDDEPPHVICPTNMYLLPEPGSSTAQIGSYWEAPRISDNSRSRFIDVKSTADATTEFPFGVTHVNITATDEAGNVGMCTFSVTVEAADMIPPLIECPPDITANSFGGPTSYPINWDQPKVTDNSGRAVAISMPSVPRGSVFPIGVTLINYTATDFSGNSASCDFTVTVRDIYPPYLRCPDDVMCLLPDSATSVAVNWTSPMVDDNSGGYVSVNVTHQPGSAFRSGITWVTYTARDQSNNDNRCEFKVIVEDPKCGPPYTVLEAGEMYSINSTNYPMRYRSYTECTWIIIIPTDTVAVISIKDFHTERTFDFVTIGGSTSDKIRPTGNDVSRYEGDLKPSRLVIRNSTIWMTFFTDQGTTYTGFWIEIIAVYPEDVSTCTGSESILLSSEKCNGIIDCPDSSDETPCICEDGEFQCADGLCMPGDVACNGLNDCGDYSDERYCPPCSQEIDLKCRQLLPYALTYYPNSATTDSTEASSLINNEYVSAILDSCHPQAYILVCATVYPECPHHGSVRVPCNGVCREVTEACAGDYNEMVGSPWPLNCDNYLLNDGDEFLCEKVEGDFFDTGICGTRSSDSRIIGGSQSRLGDWPWVASLRDPTSTTNQKCGGTLIGDRWVLTAAHCVDFFDEVYLGDLYVSTTSSTEVMVQVAEAFPHPNYDISTNEYDIAVVQLSQPVNFTDHVRPLCLATSQVEPISYYSCYIAGWGATRYDGAHSDSLQEAPIPMITREQCREYYSNRPVYSITENMVCAGYEEGRIDSCQGDSGGPLMCLATDNRWHLVGVTSFGDGCAQARSPGVYTRVSVLDSFIGDIVQQVEKCFADGGYICANNKCIPQEQVCDYRFQCSKGEDEQNCHHICSREGLISLNQDSLIEIRLVNFTDAVHIYCLWGFEAPSEYRIILRAKKYYRYYYQVEIGEGLDPTNASSVVRKLPRRGIDITAHFSVTSSRMWMTLSRERYSVWPNEEDTMLDVFIVHENEVVNCEISGEVVYRRALCDGKVDCTDESDEGDFFGCNT